MLGIGFMVFNAPFKIYFSYIVVVSFIGVRRPEYPEKTTDLSQSLAMCSAPKH